MRSGVVRADTVDSRVTLSDEIVSAATAAVEATSAPPPSPPPPAVPSAPTAAVAGVASDGSDAVEPASLDAGLYSLNKLTIDTVKGLIDLVYKENDYARFYVLETVARVPYFAYMSVMHLQETMGGRGAKYSERMRTHYAQADNELHHLLIMEASSDLPLCCCLLYTSPSPRDCRLSRMPSSA